MKKKPRTIQNNSEQVEQPAKVQFLWKKGSLGQKSIFFILQ